MPPADSSPELDVRYVANLARIELSDEEIETFQGQLGRILEYMKQLDALDVSGIEPTAHANPVYDVVRPDEPHEPLPRDAALQNAPKKTDDQFMVPKVVE
ncbi:MAG: Asp-tRNA(Asn)/Glu-tRNA(Gln) amidotransferase subunit GatC [Verrucomicrobiota bacterium]